MTSFKWGIIGLGKIAHKFASSLPYVPGAVVHAVASRSLDKAQLFAQQYNAPHALGSYEELLQIQDLDAVYIATPHSEHYANVLMCLRAGVPVLCEKAFAFNAHQVAHMIAEAQERKVFLMEAIWTRFLPATLKTLELIEQDLIGQVVHLQADFGIQAPFSPEARLFNPLLAGGSLLDLGIYPLFISKLLLGKPTQVYATATYTSTGVDGTCAMALSFANGATATLFSSVLVKSDTVATLYGTKGKLLIHSRFHESTHVSVHLSDGQVLNYPCERLGDGYCYEARHVQECLAQGLTESPMLPLQFSLELMQSMDEIRKQIGLRYPTETA
jgi:predicted dehydrogenase